MTVEARTATTLRLTALALATGTLVATGTGTAAAAAAPTTPKMSATGEGSALEITVNLPTGVSLPGLGSTITHSIALTDGDVSTLTDAPTAVTNAMLGKGATPVLSSLLGAKTTASLTGKTSDSSSAGPAIDRAGLKLALLPLTSQVADPATTVDGVLAGSSSGIARLAVTGDLLPAQLDAVTEAVQAQLAPALETTTGAAAGATTTVAETVAGAIDTLNGRLAPTPAAGAAPVTGAAKDAVVAAVTTLNATLASIQDTVTGLDDETVLVALDAVRSAQTISRKGTAVTSTVSNGVKKLDVLGGLVTVDAITSRASATAGGTPGSGAADVVAPVLDVKVADGALGFRIDEKGAQLTGLATDALPADLKPTVDAALGSVNELLSKVAGVEVSYGKGSTAVAKDGTSATSEVSATTLTVNPAGLAALLPDGKKFLTVRLVPAKAVATSRLVARAAAAPVPVAAPTALPRTGGTPVAALAATLLVGAALVARRRRAAYAG